MIGLLVSVISSVGGSESVFDVPNVDFDANTAYTPPALSDIDFDSNTIYTPFED